jgi:hypothetical protein
MQTRHRTPTIFNLSMVDVLCCALGCVILWWLLNLRNARDEAVKVGETRKLLEESQRQLQTTRADAQSAAAELAALQARLAQSEKDAATLKARLGVAEDRLARLGRAQEDLAKEKADALTRIDMLEGLLKDKEKSRVAAARRADDLDEQLQQADARIKQLRGMAELVPSLREDLDNYRKKLAALQEEMGDQKKDATATTRRIAALEAEKLSLTGELLRVRAAAESRFAGIALTGRRVVFLVDMSGSMEMLDEKAPALDKWAGVRETLAKIMRSLPALEKFQVILFSNKVVFPLANEDRWIDFDPKTSVQRTLDALAGVKPRGDTNMFAALQAAFRLRTGGLDTIYLLSDGLPNTGEGLTPEAAKRLGDRERAELLSRYIRKTLRTDWNRAVSGKAPVRINAVGFFYESPDVGAFLWALARENEGSFVGMSKP